MYISMKMMRYFQIYGLEIMQEMRKTGIKDLVKGKHLQQL